MESDLNHGRCRCCLSKGYHRDIMKEYYFQGARELYSDIFIECFNLFLSADSRLTMLICHSCIRQLKEAYVFKTNVIEIETKLLELLKTEGGNNTVLFDDNNVKEGSQVFVAELQIDGTETCDVVNLPNKVTKPNEAAGNKDGTLYVDDVVSGEDELLEKFGHDPTPQLPMRHTLKTLCPGYARHLDRLEGKEVTARMVETSFDDLQRVPASLKKQTAFPPLKKRTTMHMSQIDRMSGKKPTSIRARRESRKKVIVNTKVIDLVDTDEEGYLTDEDANIPPAAVRLGHAANIAHFLKYSNLTAFMSKFKHGYPCFYCKIVYQDFNLLREHQKEHSIDNLQTFILTQYRSPDSLVVNVDITDLKCTLCSEGIPNLKDLKYHLVNEHNIAFDLRLSDRVIPFKMAKELICLVCSCNFETFGALERHMNTHFRHFACKTCGAGFISKKRLQIHITNVHVQFPQDKTCDVCDKVFPSYRKYKIHYDLVHMLAKKVPCPKCPERFSYYYVRQKHLEDVHGEKPVTFKCNVCDKEYRRRYLLSVHIKKEHLNQHFNCELCSYTCESGIDLDKHLVRHHKELIDIFECRFCNMPFASQKNLKKHMVAHNTYTCDVCGQTYKYKSYLIRHIKAHAIKVKKYLKVFSLTTHLLLVQGIATV